MRIAILTSGRFHACDLARELDVLGHEVAFYSLVPPWRTARFGLPGRCNRWLGAPLAPLIAAARAARGSPLQGLADRALVLAMDRVAAVALRRCDVLIAMSGLGTHAAEVARQRFGAGIIIERGSRHILSQRSILESMPGNGTLRATIADWMVERELEDYRKADFVSVPSRHVAESFKSHGIGEDRLFRNPYGVSLEMFPVTDSPPPSPPTIIMTGTWSLRKGCDLLDRAWRRLPGTRLLHVGPVADAPLPDRREFEHVGAVDQRELTRHYARAHVLALPSREEGLATVQAQALASGLRVVCSDRTGGEDLREALGDKEVVLVAPSDDVDGLTAALQRALGVAIRETGRRDILGDAREQLGWRAYGRRYDAFLRHALGTKFLPSSSERSAEQRRE